MTEGHTTGFRPDRFAWHMSLSATAIYVIGQVVDLWGHHGPAILSIIARRTGVLVVLVPMTYAITRYVIGPRLMRAQETREMRLRDLVYVVCGLAAILSLVALGLIRS